MPGSKELYDKLYKEQLYTNSYNDFVAKYGTEEGQNELYNKLSEQQLYTNDINTFKGKYFADVKKKDVGVSQSSSGQPIGLSASPRNPSAYNKNIESSDWQRHQELTRTIQDAAQKNDALSIKNASKQLEQLRASNKNIASDPLLNEDLQTANKIIQKNVPTVTLQPTGAATQKPVEPVRLDLKPKAPIPTQERIDKLDALDKSLQSDIQLDDEDVKNLFVKDNIQLGFSEEGKQKLAEAEDQLNKEFGEGTFTDKIAGLYNSFLKNANVANLLPMAETGRDKALIKATAMYAKQNPNGKANEEEILQMAKDIRRKELEGKAIDGLVEDFVGDNQRGLTEGYAKWWALNTGQPYMPEDENQAEQIRATLSSVVNKTKAQEASFKSKALELQGLTRELDSYGKDLNNLTPEQAQAYKETYDKATAINTDLLDNYKNIDNDVNNLGDFQNELDLFKRNYNTLLNLSAKVGASGVRLTTGLMGAAQMVGKYAPGVSVDYANTDKIKFLDEMASSIEGAVERRKSIDEINSVGDFFKVSGGVMAEQLPQLFINASTGGSAWGLGLLASSAAGTKYNEIKDKENFTESQKIIASIATGAFEYVSEKIESNMLKNALPSYRVMSAAANGATKLELDAMRAELKGGLKNAAKRTIEKVAEVGLSTNQEGISEVVAQVGGNLVDRYVLNNKNVNVFDGLKDAYLTGAIMGGVITASPIIGAKIIAPFVSDEGGELRKNTKKINELSNTLPEIQDEKTKEIISNSIEKLKKKNEAIIYGGVDVINNLSPEEIREGSNNYQELQQIKDQYITIKNNKEMSDAAKKAVMEPLNERYNELVTKRKELINKANAIQEQGSGQVPVQPETGVSQKVEQGKPEAEPEVITDQGKEIIPKEKITVYRGIGNNVTNSENNSTLWVAEDEEVAKNYAGRNEDNTLNVEQVKVEKPSNPIELPYKLATDVRGSDIANNLREVRDKLYKSKKISKDDFQEVTNLIDDFEQKSGNDLELFTAKINKPSANEAFSKAVQALGYDSVVQKEAASKGGKMTNTYGIFKDKYPSKVQEAKAPSVSQEVKDLRAQEQAELVEAIPNIETFKVNGEIDETLMPAEAQAKYSEIYNKYDKLITPLLAEKPKVQEAKAPSIKEEGTRLPEQKAEGVRGEPTIEEEAKKKSAFDQVEGGVEAKQKSLDSFEKTRKRGQKTFAEARENAISTLKKTFAYERADDIQRNDMERELREELGEKLKKAPSVNKILGKIKNIVKVTVNEATALKEQIKLEVKAAKDAVKYINELRKNLSAEIAALEKGGKISARQAKTITNRLGKINLQNPVVVNRFVDYMTKVFNDAEYADKIRIANENKNKIKRLYKGNNVQATVSTMAKNFLTLDPKKLSDIDQYLSISNQVLQAVMRTQPAVIKDVNKYIEAAAKEQADKIKNDLLLEYQYLVDAGILDDSMSYEDIIEVIDGIEDNATQEAIDKGEDVRQYLVKMFNSLSAIGKEILSEGVDPVTGLPVDLTDDQKVVLKQFLNMDIENMSIQDAKLALEYLSNFITNGITDGMGGLVQSYAGSENFKKFKKTGAKFRDLKLFFSSKIGRAIGENITNLNILLEQALSGQDRSAIFRSLSGFNDIVNGNAKARKIANQKLIQYVEKFKGVKDFFTVENNIERGVLSFLIRTNETKEELERRKGLIEQSIEKMMNGNEKEVAKAKIIQETYERIGKDAKTVQDVIDASSKENRDAVDWWINNWSNDYDRLKDLSLNIYNADLGKDQNYTPDVYDKTDEAQEDVDNLRKSAFMMTTKDYTVKKKTGVLMEAVKPAKLNSNRVVSFDFDTNNARAYEAAMVDLETAAPIRRIDGFMNSKEFNKLGKSDDVKLIKRRINGYIGEIRGKNYVSKTSIQEINKTLDTIGSIGAALALGGITQPIKQIAPVAFNTLINTGGMLDVKLALNKDVNNWIDELGMPIGNRGTESLLTINTANKYLEEASKYKGQKALDLIKKASEVYLNAFLKTPDVFIARASFISYYKKQLKKKGVDVDNIDWATHKVDKAAAQYAQDMVDRQQNVSDAALMGDLMTSKDPWKQVIRKTTLTFMNFVLNQKARMYSDVITLKSKDSTEEDKKMARRSLAALSVEMSVYSVIGGVLSELIRYASSLVMGEEETEEQKAKRRKSRYELVATNISKDFLSPIPFTDAIVVGALNEALDQYYKITKGDEGNEEGDRFRLFEDRESSIYDNLGAAGISFERLKETIDMFTMASTGEFEQEFIPGKQTTKYLRDRDKEALAGLGLLSLGTNLGLLPSEIGSMIRTSVKIAKKRALSESDYGTKELYKGSNTPLPDYLK